VAEPVLRLGEGSKIGLILGAEPGHHWDLSITRGGSIVTHQVPFVLSNAAGEGGVAVSVTLRIPELPIAVGYERAMSQWMLH
jgi:hypothetical protein